MRVIWSRERESDVVLILVSALAAKQVGTGFRGQTSFLLMV